MAWIAVWVVSIAAVETVVVSVVIDRPRIAAAPIRSALVAGVVSFVAMSSGVPVFAVAIPFAWNVIGVLVWEVVVAGSMGLIVTVALARTWLRRQRRLQNPN